MEFTTTQGDIAEERADALVNAAGTSLRMGSVVAGALRRAANGPINEAAMAEGPMELGEVAVTDAFDLDADYVIHAAAMPHYGDGRATRESIQAGTRNALAEAEALGCRSVVLPVLGTGAAGFEFEEGARLVCESVQAFEASILEDVRVIVYSDAEHEALSEIAESVRGQRE